MKIYYLLTAAIMAMTALSGCAAAAAADDPKETQKEVSNMENYYFPPEDSEHEGTWLTWPHQYTYGMEYREEIEDIWLQMAFALHTGERVHIIAYDETERQRITELLIKNDLDMTQVDFVIAKSDDVWSRDTGPMFVYDKENRLVIADFAFDGWGKKTPYQNDDNIPKKAAQAKKLPLIEIPGFVLEGGAVELDGAGTLMAAKSSVIGTTRNPQLTQTEAESYLRNYLGARNFIWLEGVTGEDITDAHIDGMARFFDDKTILTVSEDDFFNLYENIPESDYTALLHAKNANGIPYEILELPMTAQNVSGLDYKGSYLNYYIGNKVILLPVYGDKNDQIAQEILTELYQGRDIIPIDVTSLYAYGGMLHCVTQQQPSPRPQQNP